MFTHNSKFHHQESFVNKSLGICTLVQLLIWKYVYKQLCNIKISKRARAVSRCDTPKSFGFFLQTFPASLKICFNGKLRHHPKNLLQDPKLSHVLYLVFTCHEPKEVVTISPNYLVWQVKSEDLVQDRKTAMQEGKSWWKTHWV